MASLWLILLSLAIVQSLGADELKPKATVLIYRHGDRTPVLPYKNDPYFDAGLWPAGRGQLTVTGMKQHYELGKKLRKKYNHLLSETFDPNQIYVRSTHTDRTVMSAQANLAGMFPVNKSLRFEPDLPWRPAPVFTVAKEQDDMIYLDMRCPKYVKLSEDLVETKTFLKLRNKYEGVRRYVEKYSGESLPDNFFRQISFIQDTLKIEEIYGKTLPEWTKQVYPEPLTEIAKITFSMSTYTEELTRLSIGKFLKKVTEDLIAMDKNETIRRVMVYSAHDLNIASLLNGLNLKKSHLPPYAACLMFDLVPGPHESAIQVVYEGELLKVPGCGDPCPLSSWKEKYQHLFVDDRDQECRLAYSSAESIENLEHLSAVNNIVFAIVISVLAFILLLSIITCCIMKKSYDLHKSKVSPA